MQKLLHKQRIFYAIMILIDILLIGTAVVLYFAMPDFPYFFFLGVGIATFILIFFFFGSTIFNYQISHLKSKTELTSAEIMGNEMDEAYSFGQVGLVVTDKNSVILWINDFMSQRYPEIIDEKIAEVFPEIENFHVETDAPTTLKLSSEGHIYDVEFLKDVRLYVFRDITELENVSNINQNQAPVIGYLTIDNYYDIQVNVQDESRFADMVSLTRQAITEFGHNYSAMLRSLKEDRYFFIMTKENYDKLEKDRFPLVDTVRGLFKNNSGFTISMGVSYGFDDYSKLSDLASAAIDVALSRGGDQTVVSPFGRALSYYGGKTELRPSENRVKLRTTSNALMTVLSSYQKVLIMGHDTADFDAIGSALGAYLICRHCNVNAKICWEDQHVEENCRVAINSTYTKAEKDAMFLDYKSSLEWIEDDKTLLFLVDHNNPKISMFSAISEKMANRIIIVDHHRPGAITVAKPLWDSIDSSASSASELITEYIMYSLDNIPIDSRTATFLFAGIALDTKFFHEKTSMATFEAVATLKNENADSAKVDDFLKENFEEYRLKISILNNNETPAYGTLICVSSDNEIVSPVILSKVANDATKVRGISSAFCIGRTGEHEIKISARSDGSVNCQFLMEKMGGGGHFAMAAAAFQDATVEEIRTKMKRVIADYLEDATVKTTDN